MRNSAHDTPKDSAIHLDNYTDLTFIDYTYDRKNCDEHFFLENGLTIPDKLKTAISKRRIEFLAGRYCAQTALKKFGIELQSSLPVGQNRAPQWPEGYIGSITHTHNYAAAIVAKTDVWKSVGLDSEIVVEQSKPALINHICVNQEFERVCKQTQLAYTEVFTFIFSAKESLFKALNPITKTFFGFQKAQIETVDMTKHTFTISLLADLNDTLTEGMIFSGHFQKTDNRYTTLILVADHN
jgi:4'-phosphopantetheinyl transferase EntD